MEVALIVRDAKQCNNRSCHQHVCLQLITSFNVDAPGGVFEDDLIIFRSKAPPQILFPIDSFCAKGQVNWHMGTFNHSSDVSEYVWLTLLLLKDCTDYDCQLADAEIKNMIDILSSLVPLHFCCLFHGRFELLQSSVVELIELLHISSFGLKLTQR